MQRSQEDRQLAAALAQSEQDQRDRQQDDRVLAAVLAQSEQDELDRQTLQEVMELSRFEVCVFLLSCHVPIDLVGARAHFGTHHCDSMCCTISQAESAAESVRRQSWVTWHTRQAARRAAALAAPARAPAPVPVVPRPVVPVVAIAPAPVAIGWFCGYCRFARGTETENHVQAHRCHACLAERAQAQVPAPTPPRSIAR
jgi:hypothetical protein